MSVAAEEQGPARVYQGRNAYFAYPDGMALSSRTYALRELRDKKLWLVDEAHPLPDAYDEPRTLGVAARGRGVVPVRSLDTRAEEETIDALHRFFTDARRDGVEGLTVWQGAVTAREQRERQLARITQYAATLDVSAAAEKALLELDAPAHCEYRLGSCVEIRLCVNGQPDERPLRATAQGRYLITHAWQYGLIRRDPTDQAEPDRRYRFRYVGVAHSVAMAELGLGLEEYVALLHERRVITVYKNGVPRYVIVCQPLVDGYVAFTLPQGAAVQTGVDNAGYAVAACTLN